MLFFYIRHGDPIYSPDSLTPLGERQAEALAKRLSLYGLDRIYASTSNRAIQTAKPTCELLKKEMTLVEFANEHHAWEELAVDAGKGKTWLYQQDAICRLFTQESIRKLGSKWYEHPALKAYNLQKGMDRIADEADKFFLTLGYEHIRETGSYKVVNSNDERVALFAHHGFGMAFLSCLLDIPYPQFSIHFDTCHSGMTVIEFREKDGYAIPKILTLSSDSHLYREGLPTNYNNRLRF